MKYEACCSCFDFHLEIKEIQPNKSLFAKFSKYVICETFAPLLSTLYKIPNSPEAVDGSLVVFVVGRDYVGFCRDWFRIL